MKRVENGKLLVGVLLMALVLGCFPSRFASAITYSSATDVSFTFNSVISVNLSSASLVISNLAPGEASDSNIITVGASTNASGGYQLSATVGIKNGTDALVNTVNSSNTFANLSTTKASLANFSDNTWGYSYCADTSANCNGGSGTWVSGNAGSTTAGYAGLPLDNNTNASDRGLGGVTLLNTSGPEDTVQAVQFKIGAKASNNQASGDYTNTINFYAVANPEPQLGPISCAGGYICYNVNSLGETEGTMGRQSVTSSATSAKLFASNFSRENYGFAGWNTAPDYSGTFYGPNETISFTAGQYSSQGLALYAVWVRSAGTMQSDAVPVCNSLSQASVGGTNTLASVSALTDERDGDTYAIAKLADGKCWMIENLRLDNTAELTIANTNNPLNNGTTVTLKHNYSDSSTYNTLSPTSALAYDANTAPEGWCQENSASCDDQSRLRTDNTADRISYTSSQNMSSANANLYSYGNYYNWYSATAGRGTYSFSAKNSSTTGDLCPASWRLPRGGDKTRIESNDDSDFWNLIVDALNGGTFPANYSSSLHPYYGSEEADLIGLLIRTFPNNLLYSGRVNGTSGLGLRGNQAFFWSSTVDAPRDAFSLEFHSSTIYPGTQDIGYKYSGMTVRCLISPGS